MLKEDKVVYADPSVFSVFTLPPSSMATPKLL